MAILVAWTDTNQRHRISLRLENADRQVVMGARGDIEIGRPAGLLPGSDQRGVMGINVEVQFPASGIYQAIASVGEHGRSVTFRVHDVPLPPWA